LKFRKKPVVIEAERLTWPNWQAVCELVGDAFQAETFVGGILDTDGEYWWGAESTQHTNDHVALAARISTLEGEMIANEGDWIIKGVQDELYPCKDDIFQATYELAG
jgi:hypothetical protein